MIPKIKEWLDKQGYPLEMMVARELFKNGFHSLQSSFYKDPHSEKDREIDVVGQLGFTYKEYTVNIQLIVECKNNKDKPWITFSSHSHSINKKDFITNRPCSRIGQKYLAYISEKELLTNSVSFRKPDIFSYNVSQAFEKETDRTFSATMTLVNAIKYRKEKVNSGFPHYCEIYYPVIVLGGKLFDCSLDDNNEINVTEVSEKILLLKNNMVGTKNVLIEITTFESFKRRIKAFKEEMVELITKKSNSFFDLQHTNYIPPND
jgi:hypothetical protein